MNIYTPYLSAFVSIPGTNPDRMLRLDNPETAERTRIRESVTAQSHAVSDQNEQAVWITCRVHPRHVFNANDMGLTSALEGQEVSLRLLVLHQGIELVFEFALQFCILAAESKQSRVSPGAHRKYSH